MKKNYYGSLSSQIYNLTKPPGTSIDGDIEFYTNQLMPLDGLILEAGVGNGRMLVPLLRKGIEIIGLDFSQEMLTICQQNCENYNCKTDLILANLKDFKLAKKCEAIIMPNGSLCLIEDREEMLAILGNFKNHLTASGKIYIDLIYPTSYQSGQVHEYSYPLNSTETILLKSHTKEIDWLKQTTYSQIDYTLLKDNQVVSQESQQFNLNWYGVEEFKLILEAVGYKSIEVIVNYNNKRVLNLKTVTFIAK
ncbi:class I SAM-dependent methyltransferase [Mesoplasma seiffertii]|uniref:class I SAM-dependent methyltransferase n=1 Tax=Mesoplasma seiffertii TaxID=28224 RepID=UPI00047D2B88|nr:class I SAM-dependent methyltransferase [Mesoplasma seiffertii]